MMESPLRKKPPGRSSAPSSPSRTSRASSPVEVPPPVRPNLVVQPSGSVIVLPDSSAPVPDIGAGLTSEGNVAPELEVHHAGVDMSAPDSDMDPGISHTDAGLEKTKTPEEPEQEKEAPSSPKPATPPPQTASASSKPATPPQKQTTPEAAPGGKKLTASDLGLLKRPRPSSSATSPALKRQATSSPVQSAPTTGTGLELELHQPAAGGNEKATETARPGQVSARKENGDSLGSLENWAQEWNDADMDEVSSHTTDNPRPTPHPLGGYALCRQMLAVRKQVHAGEKMLNDLSLNIEVSSFLRLRFFFHAPLQKT